MGKTVTTPRDFALRPRGATIDEGPNAGWSWLMGTDSPIQFTEQIIVLNRILDPNNVSEVAIEFWSQQPNCVKAVVLQDVIVHEQRHVDLYIQNRHILDTELEQVMAFGLDATQWLGALDANGEISLRFAYRLAVLSGGFHLPADQFPAQSCTLNLLLNE